MEDDVTRKGMLVRMVGLGRLFYREQGELLPKSRGWSLLDDVIYIQERQMKRAGCWPGNWIDLIFWQAAC